MTKDYAKQKSAMRQGYHQPTTRILSPWTFLTAGLLLGLFISCLLYLQFSYMHHQEEEDQNIEQTSTALTATDATATPVPTQVKKVHNKKSLANDAKLAEAKLAEAKKQPRFDFYTLLPSMDVDAPEMAMTSTEDLAPADVKHPLSYIIQAGSFKEFEEADTLKALLSLQGFDAPHIQTIKNAEGEARYRVYLGPYGKEDEVSSQRAMLDQFNIKDSLVLKAELKP